MFHNAEVLQCILKSSWLVSLRKAGCVKPVYPLPTLCPLWCAFSVDSTEPVFVLAEIFPRITMSSLEWVSSAQDCLVDVTGSCKSCWQHCVFMHPQPEVKNWRTSSCSRASVGSPVVMMSSALLCKQCIASYTHVSVSTSLFSSSLVSASPQLAPTSAPPHSPAIVLMMQ